MLEQICSGIREGKEFLKENMMNGRTKAQTIAKLHDEYAEINTLPYYIVDNKNFRENAEEVAAQIIEKFPDGRLAVRSSCRNEDSIDKSNAGKYCSVLNVDRDYKSIINAIDEVYLSYDNEEGEEVLVQPMLSDIIKSGVVLTRDLYTLAPYYCIEYYEGDDSSAVTSGDVDTDKTVIVYRGEDKIEDRDIDRLLADVKKIETFFSSDALDIEFAINRQHEVFFFQVRPIANNMRRSDCDLSDSLLRISKKIKKLMKPHPFLLGETTYFGVMPDWNPAEILGMRPKKLAISLYKELVTDFVWAQQREDYGYRNLTQHPLMVLFCGIPYIDTRITFNSFIPSGLNDKISEKLVNYYLDELKKQPIYHDKIEFEIVYSCYYLGLPDDLKKLLNYGFNENELRRIEYALLDLTNQVIVPTNGLYKKDIQKIEILKKNHERIMNSDISIVDKIYWLIEECKLYGTLPFAGVARAAFIAVQFLRSFVKKDIITAQEYDSFMCGLNTISKQISKDSQKYINNELSKEEFLAKYGHIRPGTYDIQSPRYDEAFDYYFDGKNVQNMKLQESSFSFAEGTMNQIDTALEQNGLRVSAEELLLFIKESIEGREYLKFEFTKTVSEILRLIEQLGERLNIGKDELAHLDIGVIKQLYVDLYGGNIADVFKENIKRNEEQYEIAKNIKLPSIIFSSDDVYQFTMMEEEANYVTMNKVIGKIVIENMLHEEDLQGKIVFVKSADPGFDFLFTKNIAGLVTQFGGANSHMAIRCSELGIPAVIGAGEKKFNEWSQADTLVIDCANKNVRIVS